jgi:hypothetical protein
LLHYPLVARSHNIEEEKKKREVKGKEDVCREVVKEKKTNKMEKVKNKKIKEEQEKLRNEGGIAEGGRKGIHFICSPCLCCSEYHRYQNNLILLMSV